MQAQLAGEYNYCAHRKKCQCIERPCRDDQVVDHEDVQRKHDPQYTYQGRICCNADDLASQHTQNVADKPIYGRSVGVLVSFVEPE